MRIARPPFLGAAAALALFAAGVAGGAGVGAATAPGSASIEIDNHAYSPAILTIAAGTTVTWKNDDDTAHNVRATDKAFASGALDTDDTYRHTFAAPGEYEYYCTLHPYMVGKIVVTAERPAS
jgi:plastocyanin